MGRSVSVSAGMLAFVVCACVSVAESQTGSRTSGMRDVGGRESGNQQTVQVELARTVRAGKAKPGDVVKASTVTSLILPSNRVIPVGSRIVGHVSEVRSGASGGSALVTIVFDRFEVKEGENAPARFLILSAALPQRIRQLVPAYQPTEQLPPGGPDDSQSPRITHTTTGGFGDSTGSTAPWMVEPIAKRAGTDGRGDLRGVPRGTLQGMPGVTLQIDETSGSARFESANRKLELRSGTQLMLEVKLEESSIAAVRVPEK